MSFITDEQTLADLNILGRFKNNSIYRIFDNVVTNSGRKILEDMFQNPLSNANDINRRCQVFDYVGNQDLIFPFTDKQFETIENYLDTTVNNTIASVTADVIVKKTLAIVTHDPGLQFLSAGVLASMRLVKEINKIVSKISVVQDNPLKEQLALIENALQSKQLQKICENPAPDKLTIFKLINYDYIFRVNMRKEMQLIKDFATNLDVYISVSNAAKVKGFHYPTAFVPSENMMVIKDIFHPSLKNPVTNTISFQKERNMIFLTGANMAGKSTLMKSYGIAVYLAHMGFPVPAVEMNFSVRDGLFSSINLPDDLNHGYSHFYAEVLRVKKVAQEVSSGKNLVIIFDELFKGTNVKDAYDATFAITRAFADYTNCFFIISTHITEVGEALKDKFDHLQYLYMPTELVDFKPQYNYKLKEGITADKQGMLIIENEGIIQLINAEAPLPSLQ